MADIFSKNRRKSYYILFSKAGFSDALIDEAEHNETVILADNRCTYELKIGIMAKKSGTTHEVVPHT